MKQSNSRPAGKLQPASGRGQPSGSRLLDLDDDIFLPADPRLVGRQPAPALAPRTAPSAAAKTARGEAAAGATVAAYRLKALQSAADGRIASLEKTIKEQSDKLSSCHDQILELSTKRDQQAHELHSSRQAVSVLEQSLAALREAATRRDAELAATLEKLQVSDEERLALRAQIHAAHRDHQHVSDRLLASETALNDQNAVTAAAWETIDRTNAELEQVKVQNASLAAELGKAKQQRRELEEQAAGLRRQLEEQTTSLRRQHEEQTTDLRKQHEEQTTDLRRQHEEQTTGLRRQLEEQTTGLRRQLEEQTTALRRQLDEQTTALRKQIETLKATGQQSLRQAEALAKDRAALQQRCEDLLRTIGLLQAARRKMSSELQVNVCDLVHLHAELSEVKASHDLITSKFEQADSKLGNMRQQFEKLEKAHAILAEYDAAAVEAAGKNGDPEQARQHRESKNELFELLETFFQGRRGSDHDVMVTNEPVRTERQSQDEQPPDASRTLMPDLDQPFLQWPLTPPDEQGADIIKLETPARGKKVA